MNVQAFLISWCVCVCGRGHGNVDEKRNWMKLLIRKTCHRLNFLFGPPSPPLVLLFSYSASSFGLLYFPFLFFCFAVILFIPIFSFLWFICPFLSVYFSICFLICVSPFSFYLLFHNHHFLSLPLRKCHFMLKALRAADRKCLLAAACLRHFPKQM